MKKIILLLGLIVSSVGYAVNQPNNIGNVKTDGLALPVYTVADLTALTSDTTGQIIFVSDGARAKVCVSTGTGTAGAWVVAVATGNVTTANYTHCQ